MKYILSVVFTIIVCLGFYFGTDSVETEDLPGKQFGESPDSTVPFQSLSSLDMKRETPPGFKKKIASLDAKNDNAKIAEISNSAQEKKKELETLIAQFDENIANPEARKLLKAKMDKALQEYNTLILPIALKQMK